MRQWEVSIMWCQILFSSTASCIVQCVACLVHRSWKCFCGCAACCLKVFNHNYSMKWKHLGSLKLVAYRRAKPKDGKDWLICCPSSFWEIKMKYNQLFCVMYDQDHRSKYAMYRIRAVSVDKSDFTAPNRKRHWRTKDVRYHFSV
jgi:hypothetical protein